MSLAASPADYAADVVASAAQIPASEWAAIWPANDETREHCMIQDEARIPGFDFAYLRLQRDGRTVLLAPLYAADFDMRLALDKPEQQQWLARAQRLWPGFMVWRTLFCGGMATEKSVIGVAADVASDPALWRAFDSALRAHARRQRARMIVLKDFAQADAEVQLQPLSALGYARSPALPMPVLHLPFSSLDAYLDSLSTGMRKDLRRKQKQTEARGGVSLEVTSSLSGALAEQAHALYMQVHDRTDLHFETLTQRYFEGFGQHLPGRAVYFLYFAGQGEDRRLIGFNLCTVLGDRLMDKYIGMDYELAHQYNLYFISFLHNVQWCIAQGLKAYVLNQGGYELKSRLGATMQPLVHMTRMVNPVLNFFQSRFA